ncbi:hypothetical protein CVT24_008311, partial [Panaeolus cyanescens]
MDPEVAISQSPITSNDAISGSPTAINASTTPSNSKTPNAVSPPPPPSAWAASPSASLKRSNSYGSKPPNSAKAPTSTSAYNTPNPRRQSSISYITPNSPSSSPSLSSKRNSWRDSGDSSLSLGVNVGGVRSPLSAGFSAYSAGEGYGREHGSPVHAFRDLGSPGLMRSSSLGAPRNGRGSGRGTPGTPRTPLTPRGVDVEVVEARERERERGPVTLAEKHADLLHFIAQKESKCLELRSQLQVHEAELLQLKRKWERIVNRGFEKSQSQPSSCSRTSPSSTNHHHAMNGVQSSTSTSTSTSITASASNSISSPPLSSLASLTSTIPIPSSYIRSVPLTSSTSGTPYTSATSGIGTSSYYGAADAANAPLSLDQLREGVQGMGRLASAGLASLGISLGGGDESVGSGAGSGRAGSGGATRSGGGKGGRKAPIPLTLGSGVSVVGSSGSGMSTPALESSVGSIGGGRVSLDSASASASARRHGARESQSSTATSASHTTRSTSR